MNLYRDALIASYHFLSMSAESHQTTQIRLALSLACSFLSFLFTLLASQLYNWSCRQCAHSKINTCATIRGRVLEASATTTTGEREEKRERRCCCCCCEREEGEEQQVSLSSAAWRHWSCPGATVILSRLLFLFFSFEIKFFCCRNVERSCVALWRRMSLNRDALFTSYQFESNLKKVFTYG